MTASSETAFDTASKTLTVNITGKNPDGTVTYTTTPASIEFHARRATRTLKCRIASQIPGTFVFAGFSYAVSGVQEFVDGLGTDALDITFQFNGRKVAGDLIFHIIDETGVDTHGSDVDPQVGNDPDPKQRATLGASLVKVEDANGGDGSAATIATTLTILTNPDGSFKGYRFSNLSQNGAFEFPKGTTNDNLNVTLAVDKPQYAGRYYIYEYFSTVVEPTATPAPDQYGQFGYGTTSVVFAFAFSSTSADQTYFSINVYDTGTDPGNIYDCDPQVGNDPDPKL
ncbi:MAG: hypothetical protein KF800_08575 [Lysobacter sp.]|nr:hypothetical protein [Lysobacter sp.]